MKPYIGLLQNILVNGEVTPNRTGIDTLSLFGVSIRYDLTQGFPALTTRRVSLRIAFEELMFFLRGQSQTKALEEKDIHIWEGNTRRAFLDHVGLDHLAEGDMGRMYGVQLRDFNGTDQLERLLTGLKADPYSRRHLISYLNPAEVHLGVLWPCHVLYQCSVDSDGRLSGLFYMRSNDFVYGHPYNVMFYALLTHFIAKYLETSVKDLIFQCGDVHIYLNQIPMAMEQVKRVPKARPKLTITAPINSLDDLLSLEYSDIYLANYDPYPDFKDKPNMVV